MTGGLPEQVVAATRKAIGRERGAMLHGHLPLRIGYSGVGLGRIASSPTDTDIIREFEVAVKRYVGASYALATSSGTMALQLALEACGVARGDRVAVPALNFVAAAEAVKRAGAQTIFYDGSEPQLTDLAAAIVPDLLGMACSQSQIRGFDCPVIEDAAAALGSRGTNGVFCGARSTIGILSFNLNKIVTTGGGGMLLTNDYARYEKARLAAAHYKRPNRHFFNHDGVGFNGAMPVPAAAVGLASLANLAETLDRKYELYRRYREAFAEVHGARVLEPPRLSTWNRWLIAISVPAAFRDLTLIALSEAGIACRALFTPTPRMEGPYRDHQQDYPQADSLFASVICLPSGPELVE